MMLYASPLALALLAIGWPASVACLAVVSLYGILWTGLHRSFHGVGGRWAERLPFHDRLKRHHMAHHRWLGRNFGTVFGWLLDAPLGTWTRADHP